LNAELIAECYIGFAKLLNDEMKAFDLKDSALFDTLKIASFTKNNPSASGTINARTSGLNFDHLTKKTSSDKVA